MALIQESDPTFNRILASKKFVVTVEPGDLDLDPSLYVEVNIPTVIDNVDQDNCTFLGRYTIGCTESSQNLVASVFWKKTNGVMTACSFSSPFSTPSSGNVVVAGSNPTDPTILNLELLIQDPSSYPIFTIMVQADIQVIGD